MIKKILNELYTTFILVLSPIFLLIGGCAYSFAAAIIATVIVIFAMGKYTILPIAIFFFYLFFL